MSKLIAEEVTRTFTFCLFRKTEGQNERLVVEGVTRNFALHRGRLKLDWTKIEGLLAELPVQFRRSSGGGTSFLEACLDRRGRQWTSEHFVMDQLFVLGMAIGKAEFCAPREEWAALPGGMPYIVLDI